jgi:nitroreductase
MNETINSILSRRSNRGFSEKPLTDEQMVTLEECALASPTSLNCQSWHFSFVTSQSVINEVERRTCDAIIESADEEMKEKIVARRYSVFYGAPMVVFISSEQGNMFGGINAGIAVQNIAIAAQALGLGSVIIGMCHPAFEGEGSGEISAKCGFPEGHKFAIAIAVGNPTVSKEAHPILENRLSIIE